MRATDVVARLSGDEFGVLLPGASDDVAHVLAERLVQRLAMFADDDESVAITASIGTVSWTDASLPDSAQAVLVEADRAMYRAKAAEGNRFVAAVAS